MKSILGISIVLILLVVGLLPSILLSPIATSENIDTQSINNSTILCDEHSSVTWTSRTQPEPLSLENESCIAGDHIVLNATFHQELNVTRCEMRVWRGFTYTTTRPLVVPTDPIGVFSGIINPALFDWVVIKGIEKDLPVSISCNFTNNDCDFMAWDGTLDQSEYTYSNNMLDMASGDKPETDSLLWTSDNDTMVLGCLNYDCTEIGNWTLNFQVGIDAIVSVNASSIEMDTYYITGQNQTCTVSATGYTDLNESIILIREQVRICNFFAPNVTVYPIVDVPLNGHNVSWSSTDRNADDVNYYSVWLSDTDGVSFRLVARNLTRTWLLWNSTYMRDADFLFRVRAYSIDFTNPEMSELLDPPEGYWPGDYSDGFSHSFRAGYIWICLPPHDPNFKIAAATTNVNYTLDSTGNTLTVSLIFYDYLPTSISYSLIENGSTLIQGTYHPTSFEDSFNINIDGLSLGFHILSIRVYDNNYYCSRTCYVNVTDSTTLDTGSTHPFIQVLVFGVSIGSVAIIAIVIILSIRLRRNQVVE